MKKLISAQTSQYYRGLGALATSDTGRWLKRNVLTIPSTTTRRGPNETRYASAMSSWIAKKCSSLSLSNSLDISPPCSFRESYRNEAETSSSNSPWPFEKWGLGSGQTCIPAFMIRILTDTKRVVTSDSSNTCTTHRNSLCKRMPKSSIFFSHSDHVIENLFKLSTCFL